MQVYKERWGVEVTGTMVEVMNWLKEHQEYAEAKEATISIITNPSPAPANSPANIAGQMPDM